VTDWTLRRRSPLSLSEYKPRTSNPWPVTVLTELTSWLDVLTNCMKWELEILYVLISSSEKEKKVIPNVSIALSITRKCSRIDGSYEEDQKVSIISCSGRFYWVVGTTESLE
jgi:tRNA uridine 5-carbamoylmethylation protein Kti12